MVDTHLIAEKMQYKSFNEDRPILLAVRWPTNRSEACSENWYFSYRMQRHFSDIL